MIGAGTLSQLLHLPAARREEERQRAEVRHRWDFTNLDTPGGNENHNDWVLMVGVTIPLGKRAAWR